jgi:hypothetical protein
MPYYVFNPFVDNDLKDLVELSKVKPVGSYLNIPLPSASS